MLYFKGIRDENSSVDANRVREDALSLYKAGETYFIAILLSIRSKSISMRKIPH